MVGGNRITSKQLEELQSLEQRRLKAIAGKDKPLTTNMESKLDELIAKRDAPFELGETAKRFIEETWLREEFDYNEPMVTRQTLKGELCEQDSIDLVSRMIPASSFRLKNRDTFKNSYVKGKPDVLLRPEKTVEDVKSSWTLRTFFEVTSSPELYFAQGQSYMDLTGLDHFRLIYVLVDTPSEIVAEEKKGFWFKYGCDSENQDYQAISMQLEINHRYQHIPEEQRFKVFEFGRDDKYLDELKYRAKIARDYYRSLRLK